MKAIGLLVLLLAAGAAPLLAQDRAAPQTSDPARETAHVVKPGETLGGVANRARVPRVLIIEANRLQPPYELRAGQKLVIPRRRVHVVKRGETGFSVAMDYGVPWPAIAEASSVKVDDPVHAGQRLTIPTLSKPTAAVPTAAAAPAPTSTPSHAVRFTPGEFAWPVAGKVRRPFLRGGENGGPHDGIDLLAPRGTAVRAAAPGRVIFAGQGPKSYGLTVILFHGARWTTTYAFLDSVTVKEGETVKAGERIGLVGSTGLATEPQLHFEVRRNRVALDPARHLPKP